MHAEITINSHDESCGHGLSRYLGSQDVLFLATPGFTSEIIGSAYQFGNFCGF